VAAQAGITDTGYNRSALQITQRASRLFNIGWPQDDQSLFSSATACEVSIFDVDSCLGEALGDFCEDAGLAHRLDREHFGFKREHARFAQEHERLGGIAYHHAYNRVIDCVRCRERMDVDFGFGQRFTHARKSAGTICKKDRELGGRFDGELGRCVHAPSK